MTDITQLNQNLPATQEANEIRKAADEDGAFESLLKFKKGDYSCAGEPVAMGTQYIAHCIGWTRCWIKFENQQVVDRKMYRVAEGRRPPDREELDSNDSSTWSMGPNGQPSDPWVYQYLLPMEHTETGDVCIFVTASIGGKRGVADLCKAYSRRVARTGKSEQPIVALAKAVMPTRMFGDVPRPQFDIVGWTGDQHESIREIKPQSLREELHDDIPF
jgi:hypothetical protein